MLQSWEMQFCELKEVSFLFLLVSHTRLEAAITVSHSPATLLFSFPSAVENSQTMAKAEELAHLEILTRVLWDFRDLFLDLLHYASQKAWANPTGFSSGSVAEFD